MASEETFIIKQKGKPNSSGWKLVDKQEDEDGFYYKFKHKKLGPKIISGPEITSEEYNIIPENNNIIPENMGLTKKPTLNIPVRALNYAYVNPGTLNTVGTEEKQKNPYFKISLNAYRAAIQEEAAAKAGMPKAPVQRPVFEEPGFRPKKGGRRRKTKHNRRSHSKTKRRTHRR